MDSTKFATRKYVDAILKASAKWPNLNLGKKDLEPGEYGLIDPETGDFLSHGNIYTDEVILDLLPELRDDEYKPKLSGPVRHQIITANRTRRGNFNASELPGTADAPIKVKFDMSSGHRGAFLVTYSPKTLSLPRNILLPKLARLEQLKKKFLVTSVICCPAYSICLTNRDIESIQLALVGTPGGEGAGWKIDRSSGIYQEGCDPAGEYKYRPLYVIKRTRRPRSRIYRDSPEPVRVGDDLWLDADSPWKSLNDDGEEEEFCDDLSD